MLHFYKRMLTIFFVLYSYVALSQTPCNQLFDQNIDSSRKWQSLLQQQHQTEIQSFKGALADEKRWLYKEKLTATLTHFEKPELITDAVVNNYIVAVMSKLQPALKEAKAPHVNVYISRTGEPNAFTPGYNTVFINAGLITRINNEAQLAFILCHEIAHLLLKHGEQAIDQYLSSIQSKEFKEQVSEIKKQEYGRGKAVEELAKKFSFDSRRHSRFKETAADSLAIVLLKNTGFSTGQVIDCLGLLDSVDVDKWSTRNTFEKYLNAPEYPIKPNYFGIARRSVFGVEAYAGDETSQRIADSLRTHPDCKKRMQYAGLMIPEAVRNTGSTFLVDAVQFYKLQQRLRNEMIEFALVNEKASRGLFYAIEQINTDSSSAFVSARISMSLNQLYEAQKNHTLGKITDLPNPQVYSKAYNELLYFIQNAKLTDLASINYYFTASALKKFPGCKLLAGSMANCAANMGKTEESVYWKKTFEKL